MALPLAVPGSVTLAHGAGEPDAGAGGLGIALGLALLAGGYALGLGRLWRRAGVGRGMPAWRAGAYFTGVLVLAVALVALDARADQAFAWHMLQHLLLLVVAAPLLVLGSPLYVLAWLFPAGWRRTAARHWNAMPTVRRAGAALAHPVTVWVTATAVLWLWHVPRLYEAAVADGRLHGLEHLSFVATSAAFWWAVLQPQGRRVLGWGAGVVYLFVTALQGSLLGALIVFARTPLYPHYAAAAVAGGRDPLADQQLAGLTMWVPGGVVYVALAAAFFVQWWREEERFQRGREATRPAAPQGGRP
jgi:putative membrane protein